MSELHRCSWAESDPLLRTYHDEEWGVPEHDCRRLWEVLMLEGFQAGLSWLVILRKREAFRAAFRNFDPELVARFNEEDVTRMMGDPGIVRSRAKINATIAGAKIYLQMLANREDISEYLWGIVGGKPILNTSGTLPAKTELSETMSAALKKRGFKFVGPVIVYAFMQATGMVNDHSEQCYRREQLRNQK